MELTKSQKAKITRAHNKAIAIYEETFKPQQLAWEEALDTFCPARDADIDQYKAERDAAIAKINAEFEAKYEARMQKFRMDMKPTQSALDKARDAAWAIYSQTMKSIKEAK